MGSEGGAEPSRTSQSRAAAGPGGVGAHSELVALPAPSSRLSARKARLPPNWSAHERPGGGWSAGLFPSRVCNLFASVLPEWQGFSISALSAQPAAPAQPPSRPGFPPHSEAGDCGDWEGLAGFARPPGAWVPGSGGCSFGVTSCFQKVEHNIRKPTRRNSPPPTRHNTHSPPLFHSFLPRFLLLPLLPPTFQPIILPLLEKGVGKKRRSVCFCVPTFGLFLGPK